MAGILEAGVRTLAKIGNLGSMAAGAVGTLERWQNLLVEAFRGKDVKVSRVTCEEKGKVKLRLEGVRIVDIEKLKALINSAGSDLTEKYARMVRDEATAIEQEIDAAAESAENAKTLRAGLSGDQANSENPENLENPADQEATVPPSKAGSEEQITDNRLLRRDVDVKHYKQEVLSEESYTIEMVVDGDLSLGELDYGDLAGLASELTIKKQGSQELEDQSEDEELKKRLMDTLQFYCKFSVDRRLLPEESVQEALAIKNETWLLGSISNWFRSVVLDQVVEQQFDQVAREVPSNLRNEEYRHSLVRLAIEKDKSELLRRFMEVENHQIECAILGLECRQRELDAEIEAREAELKRYWRQFLKWCVFIVLAAVLIFVARLAWGAIVGALKGIFGPLASIGFVSRFVEWTGSLFAKIGTMLAAHHFGVPVVIASAVRRFTVWFVKMLGNPYFWGIGSALFGFGAKTVRDFKRARLNQCKTLRLEVKENLAKLKEQREENRRQLELFDENERQFSECLHEHEESKNARRLEFSDHELSDLQADECFCRIPPSCLEVEFRNCALRPHHLPQLLASITNQVFDGKSSLDPANYRTVSSIDLRENSDLIPALGAGNAQDFATCWQRAADLLEKNCLLSEIKLSYPLSEQLQDSANNAPDTNVSSSFTDDPLPWLDGLSEEQQAVVAPFYQQLIINQIIAGRVIPQQLLERFFAPSVSDEADDASRVDSDPLMRAADLAINKLKSNFWLQDLEEEDVSAAPITQSSDESIDHYGRVQQCLLEVKKRNRALFNLCTKFEAEVSEDGAKIIDDYLASGTTRTELKSYLRKIPLEKRTEVRAHIRQHLIQDGALLATYEQGASFAPGVLDICCSVIDGVTDEQSLRTYLIRQTLACDENAVLDQLDKWPDELRTRLIDEWIGSDARSFIVDKGVSVFIKVLSKANSEQRVEILEKFLQNRYERLAEYGLEAHNIAAFFDGVIASGKEQSAYLQGAIEEALNVNQERVWWFFKNYTTLSGFDFAVLYFRLIEHHREEIEHLPKELLDMSAPHIESAKDWRVEFERLFAIQILAELREHAGKYRQDWLTEVAGQLHAISKMEAYDGNEVTKLHKKLATVLEPDYLNATVASTAKRCELSVETGFSDNCTAWIREHTAGAFVTVLANLPDSQARVVVERGRADNRITDWKLEFEKLLITELFEPLLKKDDICNTKYASLIKAMMEVLDLTSYDDVKVAALHKELGNPDLINPKDLLNLVAQATKNCRLGPADSLRGNIAQWLKAHGIDEFVEMLIAVTDNGARKIVIGEMLNNYCKHLGDYTTGPQQVADCLAFVMDNIDKAEAQYRDYFIEILRDSLTIYQEEQSWWTRWWYSSEPFMLGGFKPMVLYFKLKQHSELIPGLQSKLVGGVEGFHPILNLGNISDWKVEFERILMAQILAKIEDRDDLTGDAKVKHRKLVEQLYKWCNTSPENHKVGAVSGFFEQIIAEIGKKEFSTLVVNSIGECDSTIDTAELKNYLSRCYMARDSKECLLDFSGLDQPITFRADGNRAAHGVALTFAAVGELAVQFDPDSQVPLDDMLPSFKQMSVTQALLAVGAGKDWDSLAWDKERLLKWIEKYKVKSFVTVLKDLPASQREILLTRYFLDFAGRGGTDQDKIVSARKKAKIITWILEQKEIPESLSNELLPSELTVNGIPGWRKAGSSYQDFCKKLLTSENRMQGLDDQVEMVNATIVSAAPAGQKRAPSVDDAANNMLAGRERENGTKLSDSQKIMEYFARLNSPQQHYDYDELAAQASEEQVERQRVE